MAGAEQVAKRRLPVLFAATMAGARELAEAPDSGKATLGLKMRLQKLKESVIKEATAREAEMRDREEAWTLRAALRAVREGDTAAAARHLQERVEHLERRDRERRPFVSELDALYASSSDEEGEEEEEGAREKREADRDRDRQPGDPDAQKENAPVRPAEGKAGGGAPLLSAARAHDLLSPAYWEGVAGGQLAIAASLRPAAFAAGGAGASTTGYATRSSMVAMLVMMFLDPPLAMWSVRFAIGVLPQAMAWTAKPTMAIIASRPFFRSFSSIVRLVLPRGSKGKVSTRPDMPVVFSPLKRFCSRYPMMMNCMAISGAKGMP